MSIATLVVSIWLAREEQNSRRLNSLKRDLKLSVNSTSTLSLSSVETTQTPTHVCWLNTMQPRTAAYRLLDVQRLSTATWKTSRLKPASVLILPARLILNLLVTLSATATRHANTGTSSKWWDALPLTSLWSVHSSVSLISASYQKRWRRRIWRSTRLLISSAKPSLTVLLKDSTSEQWSCLRDW